MDTSPYPDDLPPESEQPGLDSGGEPGEEVLKPYGSLDEALRAQGIPSANHDVIRRTVQHIGIEAYYPIKSRTYLRAIRKDGRPAMMIAYGWTSGFASEQEVLDAVGDVERWPYGRVWGITHRENKMHGSSGPRQAIEHRDYGTCPNDGMKLPASGVCDLCGYGA